MESDTYLSLMAMKTGTGKHILKEIKTQDEEVFYEMVDDDTEFAALAKIFAELADEETQLLY